MNKEGLIQRDDITKEENTEYEFLFNKRINNTMINSGLEFSRPEYISDRILGGSQTKDIIGVFNQIAWHLLNTDIISISDFQTKINTSRKTSEVHHKNTLYRDI